MDDVNGMPQETPPPQQGPDRASTPAASEGGPPPTRRQRWRQGVAVGTVATFGIVVVVILAASSQAPPPMPRSSGAQSGGSGATSPSASPSAPTSSSAPANPPTSASSSGGSSAPSPAGTQAPPTTQTGQASAPTTSIPPVHTAAAPSAAMCPGGAPQAVVTYTATPELHVSNTWKVTMTGTATNPLTTPVAIVSATVEVADSNGIDQDPDKLVPDAATAPVTLDPGQSVSMSDAPSGGTQITSTGNPTVDRLAVQWTWPAGSQYLSCPSGSA